MTEQTTPESARKIMGPDFISLEEAATVFPCDLNGLLQLKSIPYSQGLLYQLSEPDHPFVLVPGIPFSHNGKTRPLTIASMRDIFRNIPNLFAQTTEFYSYEHQFIHNHVCLPQWHLLSKNPMTPAEIKNILVNQEMSQKDFMIGRAVVYVYAWLLFSNLRKESVFAGDWVTACDSYSANSLKPYACLFFGENQISMRRWSAQSPFLPSIIPLIKRDLA